MTIQQLEQYEGNGTYFRITRADDNLDGSSVETADVTREEAAMLFNINADDLDGTLEERQLYYSDEDKGIYWNGICCTDTIEGMIEYFGIGDGNLTGIEDTELVIFKGEWIESCGDGDVVKMTEIVERVAITSINW